MQVVLITLEYARGTFSGNGTYSQCIVRELRLAGYSVRVLAACPDTAAPAADGKDADEVVYIPVPASKWGRLSLTGPHSEFAAGGGAALVSLLEDGARIFIGVDWHAHALAAAHPDTPFVYMVFRLFMRNSDLRTDEERAWYRTREEAAHRAACRTIVLSQTDRQHLPGARVLNPPLRRDFRCPDTDDGRRRYVTCCCRISPEKAPHLFAALVLEPSVREWMDVHGLTPLMCGAAHERDYAESLREDLAAVYGIRDAPLGDDEEGRGVLVWLPQLSTEALVSVLRCSAVNVHPAPYDSFGMTAVEAGATGCPSLVNAQDCGATERLGDSAIRANMADTSAAAAALVALTPEDLATRGAAARAYATAYGEEEAAKVLRKCLEPLEKELEKG